MSGIQLFPGSGSGSPSNPTYTYENLGFATDGSGTSIQSGSANNKGTGVSLGTTTSAYVGIFLYASTASSTSSRYLIDLSFDNGSTWAVSNFFMLPASSTASMAPIMIPIIVGNGAQVVARCQSNSGSATIRVAVTGIIGSSDDAPGFTTFAALNADTANTLPSSTNVPLDDDGSSGWTELIASTASTYGAVMAVGAGNGTAFGAAQAMTFMIGTGAAASEVLYFQWFVGAAASATPISRGQSPVIYRSIASGTRVSAQVRAATPGTDNARIAVYGLS